MRFLVVVVLLFGAGPVLAQDRLPDAFFGDWQGVAVTTNEHGTELGITAEDLNVRIEPDGDGFRMHWNVLSPDHDGGLERSSVSARFAPTDRPGVFEFNPEQSSLLLSLFGSPATSNPLKGEPLLWARFEDGALSVYGLVISPSGGYDLYQHVRTATDDGLEVKHTYRTERDQPVVTEGLLQKTGG